MNKKNLSNVGGAIILGGIGYLIERYGIEIWGLFGDFDLAVLLGAGGYIMPDFIRNYRENRRLENKNYYKTMLIFMKNDYIEEFVALHHLIRKKTKDNRIPLDIEKIKDNTKGMTINDRIQYIKDLLSKKE